MHRALFGLLFACGFVTTGRTQGHSLPLPASPTEVQQRPSIASNVPILIVSGTLDGRTSDNDARRVGAQFGQVS